MRLCSNLSSERAGVHPAKSAASSRRTHEAPDRPRQRQHRLSQAQVVELIASYRQRMSIKELAQRFGIHRLTVTALLPRKGVWSCAGSDWIRRQIQAAISLYRQGWSLARLGREVAVPKKLIPAAYFLKLNVVSSSLCWRSSIAPCAV